MNPVVLPQLVKGMEEAVVVSRLKQLGDRVKMGDPILEVETEKAIVSIESPFSGVICRFDCQEGDTVLIGKPLCWVRVENSTESEVVISEISTVLFEAIGLVKKIIVSEK